MPEWTREPPRPINNDVLVQQDPPSEMVGKSKILYAPNDDAKDWGNTGTVLAVGPGTWERRDGEIVRVPPEVKPGDRILFKRQPASALVVDAREGDPYGWKNLVMLDFESVLGVFEEE